ncbi:MAG: DUF1289 domain-containing protein [Gallionellaceae bacterium]
MTDIELIAEDPCVDDCRLSDKDVCLGCFLSSEEVDGWNKASNQDRLEFLKNSRQRQRERSERAK